MTVGYDFYRTAHMVRAFAREAFGKPTFDFFEEDGECHSFAELLFEAFFAFASDPCFAGGAAEKIRAMVPELRDRLLIDAESIYLSDPAASSVDEVISCYPGFFAILCYRLAHVVYGQGTTVLARFICEYAHSLTGIDIHPGASIGEGFSIDHGTGVVIGETAVIGKGVKLYQGVTIGARSFPRDESGGFDKKKKRHPTIGDGCTLYANATVLGGDTVVGEGSVIGANVWLTSSVPPGSVVYYERK